MTGMLGMDPHEVRQFASQLISKADEIDQIANQLTQRVVHAQWRGNDADRFREDWNGNLRSQLAHVSEALRNAGNRANVNAQQQEQASA